MSKDLRKTFDDILREWGHDILLQKAENANVPGEEPKYSNTKLERHTVRHTYPGSRALGAVGQEEIEGVLYSYELIYYFRHDVNPRSGDRIYENIERYPNNLKTYIVDLAIPMRGKGGRIIFWATGVTRETLNSLGD